MQVAEAIHKYARGGDLRVRRRSTAARRCSSRSAALRARRRRRRRDARARARSSAARHAEARSARRARARRSGRDARHGLRGRPRRDPRRDAPTRQTALFSATMPARILVDCGASPEANPARMTIAREKTAAGKLPRVRQIAYVVGRAAQAGGARARARHREIRTSALVFCRTRLEVDTLVETLNAHGHRARGAARRHGAAAARSRDGPVPHGKLDLLIATDVAARGLDIEHLSHVINYDVPAVRRDLRPSHRPHRPRRRGGTAITLAEPREHRLLRAIEAATKQKIEVATIPTVADLRARRLEIHARVAPRAPARRRPRRRARRRRVAGARVRHRRHRGGRRGPRAYRDAAATKTTAKFPRLPPPPRQASAGATAAPSVRVRRRRQVPPRQVRADPRDVA